MASKLLKKDTLDDPVQKQIKEIIDKMNELRRWHNSKSNILQIKIKDTVKVIEELEKKKKELINSLKIKTHQTREKGNIVDRIEVKVYKALGKELPAVDA